MKSTIPSSSQLRAQAGFSLTEVILAVGVIAVSILALLGLFGPTMSSVRDVVDSNEANGVRTRLNAALMSDEIYEKTVNETSTSKFEDLGMMMENVVVLYFWTERTGFGQDSPVVLKYSSDFTDFQEAFDGTSGAELDGGSVFVVFLEEGMQDGANTYDFEPDNLAVQGYFPILVSIYAIDVGQAIARGSGGLDDLNTTIDPLFSYTTAKLR
ncbi:type IV pilus modification PilV family protein [Cerasicoccus maritimus]|uniref:type IV pilus modification PilV family protein n=1 Tax=Cerasicoccus maritimus TaxID=490089 RepID=UPI002852C44D|nr:hypothetical protein [Cerasicoccus maritimus]